MMANDRELIVHTMDANEFLVHARDIGKRDSTTMLELDLEMLEAIIKIEVDRALSEPHIAEGCK